MNITNMISRTQNSHQHYTIQHQARTQGGGYEDPPIAKNIPKRSTLFENFYTTSGILPKCRRHTGNIPATEGN